MPNTFWVLKHLEAASMQGRYSLTDVFLSCWIILKVEDTCVNIISYCIYLMSSPICLYLLYWIVYSNSHCIDSAHSLIIIWGPNFHAFLQIWYSNLMISLYLLLEQYPLLSYTLNALYTLKKHQKELNHTSAFTPFILTMKSLPCIFHTDWGYNIIWSWWKWLVLSCI